MGIVRSADTSPEAHELQIQLYCSMSPARRLEIALTMSEEAGELTAAGIRARHPEYGEREVMSALRRMRLGDDLFREVYPDEPLLSP